jgi:hypothetical protein
VAAGNAPFGWVLLRIGATGAPMLYRSRPTLQKGPEWAAPFSRVRPDGPYVPAAVCNLQPAKHHRPSTSGALSTTSRGCTHHIRTSTGRHVHQVQRPVRSSIVSVL